MAPPTLTRDCLSSTKSHRRLVATWVAIACALGGGIIASQSIQRAAFVAAEGRPSPVRSEAETQALGDLFATPDGSARRQALDAYTTFRDATCEWEDQGTGDGEFVHLWWKTDASLKADYWGDLTSWMVMTGSTGLPRWVLSAAMRLFAPPKTEFADQIRNRYCRAAADDEEAEWRVRRIGPFTSTGGFDWHRVRSWDPFELYDPKTHAVVSTVLGPVDDTGAFISNPPIHIHHANLLPSYPGGGTNFSRIDQWHGDSQCTDATGGVSCYLRALPAGVGFPLAGASLTVDADFNDVRPEGSPPMNFSLEVAVRLRPLERRRASEGGADEDEVPKSGSGKALTEAGVLILGSPSRLRWWHSSDFALTYFCPTTKPSAIWTTAQMPVSGTLVDGHLYTHQGLFDEAWVFSGVTPNDLQLNRGRWKLHRPWEPLVASRDAEVAELKAHVMRAFKMRVRECGDSCRHPPALRYVINTTAIEDGEARQMTWPQPAFTFAKGEHMTTLVFHKPLAMGGGMHMQEMQQHLALHATYVPPSGASAEYHMVLPSDKPGWSAVDRSSTLRGFLHFGGPDSVYFRPFDLIAIAFAALVLYVVCRHTPLRRPLGAAADWLWSCSSPATWRERAVRTNYGDEEYIPGDLTRAFFFKHIKGKVTTATSRGLRQRTRGRGRGAHYELVPTTDRAG